MWFRCPGSSFAARCARRSVILMRLQLALNVDDIDEAVDYYSRLFGAEPAKRREGYANFAIDEPPLKLVLFENPGNGGTINHLGVETESAGEVEQAHARMVAAGLTTSTIDETMCCYAGEGGDLGHRSARHRLGVVREAG